MAGSGAELFARYAYPPNELGYCGPGDAAVLLGHDGAATERRIARHARQFEGAWPYLEIIAEAAGIADPLDLRVVEAYWIGNELLDAIEPDALARLLRARFTGQLGASWVPGRAHHSYHVFSVYPWVGLLGRGGATERALSILEQCRIRWGEVVAVDGGRVRVRSRPLVLRAGLLELGDPREETAAWSAGGRSLLDPTRPVAVGDQVAMHWDWVCDILTPPQLAQLADRTTAQLTTTNTHLRTTV